MSYVGLITESLIGLPVVVVVAFCERRFGRTKPERGDVAPGTAGAAAQPRS